MIDSYDMLCRLGKDVPFEMSRFHLDAKVSMLTLIFLLCKWALFLLQMRIIFHLDPKLPMPCINHIGVSLLGPPEVCHTSLQYSIALDQTSHNAACVGVLLRIVIQCVSITSQHNACVIIH